MSTENQTEISEELDAEQLMAERQRLEALFNAKFTKVITVMFTDLKGSTALTESEGDLVVRELMKTHNDMFAPILAKYQGILVKTIGDGTMSYFAKAQDAALCACQFQRKLKQYNSKDPKIPIIVTTGIHTGKGIVEKNDIYGDVVNVAARLDGEAEGGEICVSEETFQALDNKAEIYCRYIRTAKLKGKKDEVKIFKIFWDAEDIETDKAEVLATKAASGQTPAKQRLSSWVTLTALLSIALIAVFMLIKGNEIFTGISSHEAKRSTKHSVLK
jgi:adenylate cyclase